MMRTAISTLVVATVITGTALAVEPTLGAKLGTELQAIGEALAADGYKMTRYERENGRIEVTAIKENRRHEMYVDATTGEVVKIEDSARKGPSSSNGVDDNNIRASLKADGYEVTKYERERGKIEVYARKDDRLWELKIDPRSGRVLRAEEEN